MPEAKSKAVEPVTVDLVSTSSGVGILPASAIRDAVKNGTKLRVNLDNADIAAAMLDRKLSATTIEELDSSGELDDIDDIYGQAVQVNGVGFRNSDEAYASGAGSLGVYVVLSVVTLAGEMLTVATGAVDVVVTACKIAELDKLGTWWIIAKSERETAAGYKPVNMTPAKVNADGAAF